MNIILLVILFVFSAFFSGSETAFFSLGKVRFKQIENMHSPFSKRVIRLLSDPHKLIITIIIGNTLVNIAASSVMAGTLYDHFGEKGVALSIFMMTALLLVFGEVTPKMFALSNAMGFSFFASLPLVFFEKVFGGVGSILNRLSDSMLRAAGIHIRSEKPVITEQELRHLFRIGKKKGVVKEKERDMVENVLELKDLNAADIMTPRIDVIALDITEDQASMIGKIRESQFARLPVFVHDLDNIIGMIHTKDYLLNPYTPIKNLVKKPLFVPESMRVDDLLNELQKRRTHLAVVTDEYGVTSGVVTIEDILEEIVGEIRDEFDFESPGIKKLDRKTFEVKGKVHLNELNEKIRTGIETDEVDTIGGYVILMLGRIPQAGDTLKLDGYLVTVIDVSKNRITRLKMEKTK